MKLSVFAHPYSLGNMKIINVKYFMHKLMAKWLLRNANAAKDQEIWVSLAWRENTNDIPGVFFPGL